LYNFLSKETTDGWQIADRGKSLSSFRGLSRLATLRRERMDMSLDVLRHAEDLLIQLRNYESAAAPLGYTATESGAVLLLPVNVAAHSLGAALAQCGFTSAGSPRLVLLR
jgi:hypothetical protein